MSKRQNRAFSLKSRSGNPLDTDDLVTDDRDLVVRMDGGVLVASVTITQTCRFNCSRDEFEDKLRDVGDLGFRVPLCPDDREALAAWLATLSGGEPEPDAAA